MPLYFLMAIFPCTTGSHCRQVTIFLENVRFRNMRIMTLISIVSWLPMASSTSPFTYGAVEVIFGSIYFYFHLQTAPDLQDCPHSTNLPTIPESTLHFLLLKLGKFNDLIGLDLWLHFIYWIGQRNCNFETQWNSMIEKKVHTEATIWNVGIFFLFNCEIWKKIIQWL